MSKSIRVTLESILVFIGICLLASVGPLGLWFDQYGLSVPLIKAGLIAWTLLAVPVARFGWHIYRPKESTPARSCPA